MHVPGAETGGHCPVKYPWLLKYGLTKYGTKSVDLNIIESNRYRNLDISKHIINLVKEGLIHANKKPSEAVKVAVLGVAFIEDSDDPRNTPTRDLIR